ncbi:STAS domain-containing protein [Lysinibacillus sp. FSL K6-3209]|uniref:STAS domain-containing protein n=1 Tax=Lysinibacillus sp. FSL K6-3209 TaxID=2921497 RepID=UPI0030D7F382
MNQKNMINIDTKADYILIAFTGKLEYGLIGDIKEELHAISFDTKHGYIIDMQKVANIDSTGFGMIINFAKKVTTFDKKIAIIVTDDFIRKLFAISQCDKVFPIAKNELQAKQFIKEEKWLGELALSEY